MMIRRLSVGAALVLAAAATMQAPRAAAEGEGPICAPPSGFWNFGNHLADIDGDHISDPLVGVPGLVIDGQAYGGFDVLASRAQHGAAPDLYLGADFAGLDASPSFGTTIVRVDVNSDGCDDLLVSDPGHAGGAAVDVLWGRPNGTIDRTGATQLVEHGGSADGFGASIALSRYRPGGEDGPYGAPLIDLWVGAPGRTVDGLAGAGAVEHFRLNPDGTSSYLDTVTEDDFDRLPGVHASAGNHFGSVLNALSEFDSEGSDISVLLAGVPNETVNGKAGAGAVLKYPNPGTGTNFIAQEEISQDSRGIGGTAEPGDHFGAALSLAQNYEIAIGVPGEDLGTTKDAGLVTLLVEEGEGDLGSYDLIGSFTQNTPGVPGVAEAGDRFGAAVAAGTQFGIPSCTNPGSNPGAPYLAVGVPGEDNAGHADSGTVALRTVRAATGPNGSCIDRGSWQGLTQGAALGGSNEAGDQVGAALGALPTPAGKVVVGVPGEDVAGMPDSGVAEVYSVYPYAPGGRLSQAPNSYLREAGLRFGAVIPVESLG